MAHTDATGYLLDLRHAQAEAWFESVCDLAVSSAGQPPQPQQLQNLWELFHGSQPYTPIAAIPPTLPAPAVPLPPRFLEKLSNFSSFKRLSPDLSLQLSKQVTLIFGKNGSGKSSICQALKVLSNGESPVNPLHNARDAARPIPVPSFSYRLAGAPADVAWTPTVGFGTRADAFKYFDSTIATLHVSGALPVDSSVQIVVFRLEVFEYARAFVQAFQTFATQKTQAEKSLHQATIDQIRNQISSLVALNQPPFAAWSVANCGAMLTYIQQMPVFDTAMAAELANLQVQLQQLQSGTTQTGLQSLLTIEAVLHALLNDTRNFKRLIQACEYESMIADRDSFSQKQAALAELSRTSFPSNVEHAKHHSLISAAAQITNFATATTADTHCPLCYQQLSNESASIFRNYHAYLTSTLQQEAQALQAKLTKINANLAVARQYRHGNHASCQTYLPEGFLGSLTTLIQTISQALPVDTTAASPNSLLPLFRTIELDSYITTIEKIKVQYAEAMATASQGQAALADQIQRVDKRIRDLLAHNAVWQLRSSIETVCLTASQLLPSWSKVESYNFSNLLAALTRKGKLAHTDLVRTTFEASLSNEYQRLCGSTSQQMGVQLHSTGEQQDVLVSPRIGGDPVHRVLSEGEQKVHALAVFFCEASMAKHQILVLDDPVTSFDYNNVSNLATRIRDLARDQPATQIIIFTHQWDFFVNLQTVFNRSSLDSRLSIQVLEDRSTIKEYVDKWVDLCTTLDAILLPGIEPSAEQKEQASGYLRRLIERLTNAEVFNEQRHQYKVKSQPVSDFIKFTKIVPLQIAEAHELRDLYAELSPPEHDDVRNYYATKSGNQFRHWYSRIKALQSAINGRRPP